ncbi:hypothetical protein OROHE_007837 [Orobanche hederae]
MAPPPVLPPPSEPPPLAQSLIFNVTEALPTVDLPKDRPAPKPLWQICGLTPLAIWLRVKASVRVALRVFVEMTVHPLLFGTGLLQLGTIVTTTNFIILSASQGSIVGLSITSC